MFPDGSEIFGPFYKISFGPVPVIFNDHSLIFKSYLFPTTIPDEGLRLKRRYFYFFSEFLCFALGLLISGVEYSYIQVCLTDLPRIF